MKFLQKYICEVICVINLIFIAPNHDFSIWWQKPVMNDAMGYYSYLPAVFIYQDLTYNFIYEPWKKHYPEMPCITTIATANTVLLLRHSYYLLM